MSVDDAAGRPLKIFINYRHADTQSTAGLVYTRLEQHFGADNVFYDRGALTAGMRWLEEIKSRLAEDGVLIALIGQQWLSILTANMRNSQDDDYVVKEIDLAFRSRGLVTVIPVLADNANFPGSADLPRSLKPLPDWQAAQLRPANLRDDIDSLIARLDEIRSHPPPTPKSRPVPLPGQRPRRARRQVAPRPDEEHYQMVTGQADNLVVFLGAGANADDREAPWSAESGTLPDDRDLACAGRKLGYRFWPGLSRGGPVLVEQSAQTLPASDPVDPGRERDHVRCVFGGTQKHSVALVAAPGVVMGDVDVEHVA